jgi:multidrug resistance efflux pump
MAKTTEDLLSKIVDKLDDLQKSTHNIDKEVALQKAAAEERHADIRGLQDEAKRNNEILAENTKSLQEHMARTDLLEAAVKKMDERLTPIEIERIEKEAVAEHRKDVIIKIAKITGALTAIVGLLAAVKPFLLALLSGL